MLLIKPYARHVNLFVVKSKNICMGYIWGKRNGNGLVEWNDQKMMYAFPFQTTNEGNWKCFLQKEKKINIFVIQNDISGEFCGFKYNFGIIKIQYGYGRWNWRRSKKIYHFYLYLFKEKQKVHENHQI